jgi:hypothetical protein
MKSFFAKRVFATNSVSPIPGEARWRDALFPKPLSKFPWKKPLEKSPWSRVAGRANAPRLAGGASPAH